MEDCLFCKIARGEIPSYKIWENKKFIAFLDINPYERGMTLVIPKKHEDSYLVNVETTELTPLMDAVKEVAKILDQKLPEILRTSVIFEGLDVPHLHAKLIPIYKGKFGAQPTYKTTMDELKELADLINER